MKWLDGLFARDPEALVTRLVKVPPRRLSELEKLLGSLRVDFARSEGFGSFMRARDGALATQPHGTRPLPPGLSYLWVSFYFDVHHEEPRRPRDVTLSSVSYGLDLPGAKVREILLGQRGLGRPVMSDRGVLLLEHAADERAFFYVDTAGESVSLCWEAERPEWAYPKVEEDARASFLHLLVDAATTETTEKRILARIAPHAASVGFEISSPYVFTAGGTSGGVSLLFRPELTVLAVVGAFGWEQPAASSGDVHMSSRSMGPFEAMRAPPWRPAIGSWLVEAHLSGWPRGAEGINLPELGARGPSPLYDVAACVVGVRSIGLAPRGFDA